MPRSRILKVRKLKANGTAAARRAAAASAAGAAPPMVETDELFGTEI